MIVFIGIVICVIFIFLIELDRAKFNKMKDAFETNFLELKYKYKHKKPQNKVRFFVAKDKVGKLWLYLGKPTRDEVYETFMSNKYGCLMVTTSRFKYLGLNPDDFKNLKWEDEPVEVFINMED